MPCQPCTSGSAVFLPNNNCLFKLPGTCVYYSGTSIAGTNINTGDIFNVVVTKLIAYISSQVALSPPFAITSSQFSSATVYNNNTLTNDFLLFWNELSRFLLFGSEWIYQTG